MGGKTAMTFALLYPERVSRLAILDIAPVRYRHSHVGHLDALMSLDLSALKSRGEADRALQAAIPETSTRLFLLQSLSGSPGAYCWRLNLPVLREFMSDIVGFPDRELTGKSSDLATVVIYGKSSDYVKAEHRTAFKQYFSNVDFKGITQAGHWLHVDQPQSVVEALLEFVQQGEKND
jgi:pimeloyl-ACP methyl ester carboxylesterase